MKKLFAVAAVLSALFLISEPVLAQRTRLPIPATGASSGRAVNQQPVMPDELEKNISISISGTMAAGMPVELTLTGCGRIFRSEAILGTTEIGGNKVPTVGKVQYHVRPIGNGYIVEYSIGARIAIPTSSTTAKASGAKTTSIGFEEISVDGTVRCLPDEAIEIVKSGDQAMTLKAVEN